MKITKDYYANAQNFQLRDFMKELSKYMNVNGGDIYTMEEGFFFLNAVKYKIRAGLKNNNTFEDDMTKYQDYKDDLLELGHYPREVDRAINAYVDLFHNWKGQWGEEFSRYMEV